MVLQKKSNIIPLQQVSNVYAFINYANEPIPSFHFCIFVRYLQINKLIEGSIWPFFLLFQNVTWQ